MSLEYPQLVSEEQSPVLSWVQTWIRAVTRLGEQTYAEMADSPGASVKTAWLWVFTAGLIRGSCALLSTLIPMAISDTNAGSAMGILGDYTIYYFFIAIPVGGAFSVLFFALNTALIQFVATRFFNGSGSYEKLIYPLAAIAFPTTLVSSVLTLLGAIPLVGILTGLVGMALGFYALVLQIMAVKGVNKFGWGQAIGSYLIPGVVIGLVVGCITVAVLMSLAPMVGDVFSTMDPSLLGGY